MAGSVVWVDMNLPPALCGFLRAHGFESVHHFGELGLDRATDREAFLKARTAGATVITKDQDFPRLVRELGPPPAIIWIRLVNSTSKRLNSALAPMIESLRDLLSRNEALIEIVDLDAHS